jgi:tetratricopeptide (TPR) repeat protein
MGMLKRLLRQIVSERTGQRQYEAHEVRRLIDGGELAAAERAIESLADSVPQRDIVRTCLRAEVAFRQFRDEDAEARFRDVLREEPGLADAHYGLALVMLARGDAELALRHAQFAANKAPEVSRFQAQLGLCSLELKSYTKAQAALARATRLEPDDKSSWNNYGIALRAGKDLAAAKRAFTRAVALDPAFAAAANNLALIEQDIKLRRHVASGAEGGTVEVGADESPELLRVRELAALGRAREALDACEALVVKFPDDLGPTLELYRMYREQGDEQSGLDALQALVARQPENLEAVAELGLAYERAREFPRAKPLLERALEARPDSVPLLLSMAACRTEQSRYADAGELIERAYALEPTIHMKGRLAASLVVRCRYEDTLRVIDEMLAEDQRCGEAVAGIQIEAYTQLGRHDEALPIVERLLQRNPNEMALRFARASIRLLNEDYGRGWEDYAWRNLGATKHLRMVAFPQWQGEPLEGKRILVLAEQGLGDQVMLASCLPDLLALRPAKVVVEAVTRVAPTLARSFPECEVVATKQDAGLEWVREHGDMDYFIPMGDLPQQFRRSIEAFPAHKGYLRADPDRVSHWRRVLGELGPGPKIGLSWRGGTEKTRTAVRTMQPEQLAALARGVHAQWICLQYGDVSEGLERAREAGMPMHYWKAAVDDLDEFSALTTALDLVVTVCNTTVHYAGALGKPVWVMAPMVPEWRYGLRSERMPWYPSSRMYRQTALGDWDGLVARVRQDLSLTLPAPLQVAG